MASKSLVEALRRGQAVTHEQRKARDRLRYALDHGLKNERSAGAIKTYLADPTPNAAVLIFSENKGGPKDYFKRASLARDLETADASFHIPTRCLDPNFMRLSMDGLNNKLAAMQQAAHGTDFDGFYLAAPLTNIPVIDDVTMKEFERLVAAGFHPEEPKPIVEEVRANIQASLPPDSDWNPELLMIYADGDLAEHLARSYVRMEENNARIEAHLGRLNKPGNIDRLHAASQAAFTAASKLWGGFLTGLRDTVEECKVKLPDGHEVSVKLRKPDPKDVANDNAIDGDKTPPRKVDADPAADERIERNE